MDTRQYGFHRLIIRSLNLRRCKQRQLSKGARYAFAPEQRLKDVSCFGAPIEDIFVWVCVVSYQDIG